MGDVQTKLRDDHCRLEKLLDQIATAAAGAGWLEVQAAWDELEAGLLAHLDAEETHLLPILETSHPEETGRIRREHQRFREEVADLGVRTQVHSLRKEQVDRFCDELREHAAREDRMLYRWADEIVSEATRHRLLTFLVTERARRLEERRRATEPPPRSEARP